MVMRMSPAVITASRLRSSAAITVAVRPCGSRSSKGANIAQIWPPLVALLNVVPSMPEYTEVCRTPGVFRMIGIACCTMASVRARLVPGGMVIEIATLFWSCTGMNPRGVSSRRQPVSATSADVEHADENAPAQQHGRAATVGLRHPLHPAIERLAHRVQALADGRRARVRLVVRLQHHGGERG